MSTFPSDTRPEAERVHLDLIRRSPAWRRVQLAGQMFETMKSLAMSGLRQRYPQAAPEELRRRLADLLLGPALATRAYGPSVKGEVPDVE